MLINERYLLVYTEYNEHVLKKNKIKIVKIIKMCLPFWIGILYSSIAKVASNSQGVSSNPCCHFKTNSMSLETLFVLISVEL